MNPIRPRSRRQFLATAAGATAGLAAAATAGQARPASAAELSHATEAVRPGPDTAAAGSALDVPAGLSWPPGQRSEEVV